jgi:plastocyanin
VTATDVASPAPDIAAKFRDRGSMRSKESYTMPSRTRLAWMIVLCALVGGSSPFAVIADPAPVYVHMNGANFFVESTVAVEPGQAVVFVSQDTGGVHTILGYDANTGGPMSLINGKVRKSVGPGHRVDTYTVRLRTVGVYPYYCSVHATLEKTMGGSVQPAHRLGIDGFKGAMAGSIVVTHDRALIDANPPTSKELIIPGFFGG